MTIGSSDIAVLLGGRWAPPWADASPWQVLRRCRGQGNAPIAERRETIGRLLEKPLLQLAWQEAHPDLSLQYGPELSAPPYVFDHHLHARPDGVLFQPGGLAVVALEAKTTHTFDAEWGPTGSDEVPAYYLPQCWWHMRACKVSSCLLVAFATDTQEVRIYRIQRDREVEQTAVDFALRWYRKHVTEGHPLSWDGSLAARAVLDDLHPPPPEGEKRPDAPPTARFAHLYGIREGLVERRKALDTAIDKVTDAMRAEVGAAGRIVNSRGKTLATYADAKPRRSVDTDALRLEVPDLVEKHTTMKPPKTARRLTIYQGKTTS